MSGFLSKGSTEQGTVVQWPEEIRRAAENNINIANEVATIGYTPYQGNTVAGVNRQLGASMMNNVEAANAFDMQSGGARNQQELLQHAGLGRQGFDGVTTGFRGVDALHAEQNRMPAAQRLAIESFIRDPHTGMAPFNASVPLPQSDFALAPGFQTQRRPGDAHGAMLRDYYTQGQARYDAATEGAGRPPSDRTIDAIEQWRREFDAGNRSAPGDDTGADRFGGNAPSYDDTDSWIDDVFGDDSFIDNVFGDGGGSDPFGDANDPFAGGLY